MDCARQMLPGVRADVSRSRPDIHTESKHGVEILRCSQLQRVLSAGHTGRMNEGNNGEIIAEGHETGRRLCRRA